MSKLCWQIDRLAVAGIFFILAALMVPNTQGLLRTAVCSFGIAVLAWAWARRLIPSLIKRYELRARRGKAVLEFHSDLFELRTSVLETLADHDIVWLSDFGAVDLQHDIYGLEVTAIRTEDLAIAIERLLSWKFPRWRHRRTFFEDQNVGELGWKVMISRYPEDFDDSAWRTGT